MKRKIISLLMASAMIITGCSKAPVQGADNQGTNTEAKQEADAGSSATTVDGTTSASIVPDDIIREYKPKGFTDKSGKKALFVVGDPRKYSVNYDLVYTAMKHFEEKNVEVEIRDLYDLNFNPVLSPENFYHAKDGSGEASPEIKTEQDYIEKADYIIFCYPNWHDTPNAMVKGYMETVFAKQWAYKDAENGLEGLLKDKSIYTIMNAGFLGGGRGYINDGVGIDDAAWNEYMGAFKVLDDDTAGFWGVSNKGRFVNDRTPKNNSPTYQEELDELRDALIQKLNKDFFS